MCHKERAWSFLFLLLFLGLVFGGLGFVSSVCRYSICARRPSPRGGHAFLRFIGTKTHNGCGSWFRTDGRFRFVFIQYATKTNKWKIKSLRYRWWFVHGLNPRYKYPMVLLTHLYSTRAYNNITIIWFLWTFRHRRQNWHVI